MPPSSENRDQMIFFVLVLWTRTSASGPDTFTNPSSTANGPMAEDILPQFPP
jgi:hypothetical protein